MSEPIKLGSYAQLSDDDKALVDSILATEAIQQGIAAATDPKNATFDQKMFQKLVQASDDPSKSTATPEQSERAEALLEMGRDHYAADSKLIADLREVFRDRPKEHMKHFTSMIDNMIAVDGDQFDLQRDLPQAIAPDSPALKR